MYVCRCAWVWACVHIHFNRIPLSCCFSSICVSVCFRENFSLDETMYVCGYHTSFCVYKYHSLCNFPSGFGCIQNVPWNASHLSKDIKWQMNIYYTSTDAENVITKSIEEDIKTSESRLLGVQKQSRTQLIERRVF